MSDRITMAKAGTQYSEGSVSLSWPSRRGRPVDREVIELPRGKRSRRIQRMIVEGSIIETNLPVARFGAADLEERPPLKDRLMGGGSKAALEHMKIPAGPVVRQVFVPAGEVVAVESTGESPTRDEFPKTKEPEAGRETVDGTELNETPLTRDERIAKLVDDHTKAELVEMAETMAIEGFDPAAVKVDIATLMVDAAPADPADEE